ncbi:MAG: DUF2800 domain-containing protein [Burkholderiaceae bacterium]
MTVHAILSASSAHRWMACPGSINLIERLRAQGLVVDRTSSYAIEGSAAHELAERCLRQAQDASGFIGQYLNTEGDTPVEVTEDMATAVQSYLDFVRSISSDTKAGECNHFIEQMFDLSMFYKGLFGTSDYACMHRPLRTLFVCDYKHGQGLAVDAIGNPQLRYYGLGALIKLKELNLPPPFPEWVSLNIVQPRAPHHGGPVRNETIRVMELLAWAENLIQAAKDTEPADAPLHEGEHCRFCPAAPRCPRLQEVALKSAQITFKPIEGSTQSVMTGPVPVKDLNHEQLLRALAASEVLEPWLKELHAHAQELLERGNAIDGWKLVQKRATRKWIGTPTETAFALQLIGLTDTDIFEEPELRSPAQIEKHLPRKRHPELAPLVIKESSGVVLAADTDPRPAVRMALPFSVIPQLESAK